MNIAKRLLAAFATLAMAFCIATPAFAVENVTLTFPVDTAAHTYKVWQIMTGNPSGNTLGSATWGINSTNYSSTEGADNSVSDEDLATLTATLATGKTEDDRLAAVTAFLNKTGSAYATVTTSTENEVTQEVVPGYYLIEQTSAPADGESQSRSIVLVANTTTVSYKKRETTAEKKVRDYNDSETENSNTQWQDSADYDINDLVPFKLTAHITENYADYTTYKIVFHDTLSKGLTYDGTTAGLTVTYSNDGTTFTTIDDSNYTVSSTVNDDGTTTLTVTFSNLKNLTDIKAESEIVIAYSATLNNNAVVGVAGNPNKFQLEYSNNPDDSTSTTKTPEDTVVVFTYQVTVNKYETTANGEEALKGAGFTLYKYDADSTAEDKYVAVGSEVKGTDMTSFVFTGLDDGRYKLVETTVPDGYNKMTDLVFQIQATHLVESSDPKLKELKVLNSTGTDISTGDNAQFTVSTTTIDGASNEYHDGAWPTGEISTGVENKKGSSLPTTGAKGTMMLVGAGALVATCAAVFMVTRKKMSIYED